jgi:nuclear transport factor 2 (NTF2) superfamily protein
LAAQIVTKYIPAQKISITEEIANKRRKKQLYVANIRKSPKTNKTEYQLTENKDDTTTLYMNGKWFPEKDVHLA